MAYGTKQSGFEGTRYAHFSRPVTRASWSALSAHFAAQRAARLVASRPTARERAIPHMRRPLGIGNVTSVVLVAVALCVVHCDALASRVLAAEPPASAAQDGAVTKERAFHGELPESVIEMREEILAAIHAGAVADLSKAAAWSEARSGRPVDFGLEGDGDPLSHWTHLSGDGAGLEVLAIAANLLALPPARLAIGKDPENTFVYVWPYLAELPGESLTPTETVDLMRLVPAETAQAIRKGGKWPWWRIAIAADGTWLVFRRYE